MCRSVLATGMLVLSMFKTFKSIQNCNHKASNNDQLDVHNICFARYTTYGNWDLGYLKFSIECNSNLFLTIFNLQKNWGKPRELTSFPLLMFRRQWKTWLIASWTHSDFRLIVWKRCKINWASPLIPSLSKKIWMGVIMLYKINFLITRLFQTVQHCTVFCLNSWIQSIYKVELWFSRRLMDASLSLIYIYEVIHVKICFIE